MSLADLLDRYRTVLSGVEEALSRLRTAKELMEHVQTLLDRRVVGIQYALGVESQLSAPEPSPSVDEESSEVWEKEQAGSHPGVLGGSTTDGIEIEVITEDEDAINV